jgi:hypothetical protein
MKPFNLERALAGDTVITRDGRGISEFHYFATADNEEYPVFAVIDSEVYGFTTDGKEFTPINGKETESDLDLFMGE